MLILKLETTCETLGKKLEVLKLLLVVYLLLELRNLKQNKWEKNSVFSLRLFLSALLPKSHDIPTNTHTYKFSTPTEQAALCFINGKIRCRELQSSSFCCTCNRAPGWKRVQAVMNFKVGSFEQQPNMGFFGALQSPCFKHLTSHR